MRVLVGVLVVVIVAVLAFLLAEEYTSRLERCAVRSVQCETAIQRALRVLAP